MTSNIKPNSKRIGGYYGDQGVVDCIMDAVKFTKQGFEVTRAVRVGQQLDLYGYNPKEFKDKVESTEIQLETPVEAILEEGLEGVQEKPTEPDFNFIKGLKTTEEIESYMEQFGVNISSNVKVGTARKQAKDKWDKLVSGE